MANEGTDWVLDDDAWHRFDRATRRTACGKPIVDLDALAGPTTVNEEIARNQTTVCDRCERLVAHTESPPPSGEHREPMESPEQQELRERIEEQRKRSHRNAEKMRRATARDGQTRAGTHSVRTVSGGLPTLGKKKQ